jgi:PAT family beta-lactamase induction signal transducer AmpG
VLIGTGLTDKIDAFAWAFGAVLPEAVLAVLSAGLAESGGGGVLIQFAWIVLGFGLLFFACAPVPGWRAPPALRDTPVHEHRLLRPARVPRP